MNWKPPSGRMAEKLWTRNPKNETRNARPINPNLIDLRRQDGRIAACVAPMGEAEQRLAAWLASVQPAGMPVGREE